MSSDKILIVDDDRYILNLVKSVVEHLGFTAVTVVNGREALNEIERQKFRLIVCDDVLPYMRGGEVALRMREQGGLNRETAFILLHSGTSPGQLDHIVKNAKISSLLPKPFSIQAIKNLISMTLTIQINY
jgi:CheY-like chemotaxis protein